MNTRLLVYALISNAVFSGLCGLVMLGAPDRVATLLGLASGQLLIPLGVGLLLFAVELTYQATRQRMAGWRALLASIADSLWVLGSALALSLFPEVFSPAGRWLIATVAILVMVFATLQLWGLRRLYRGPNPGVYRYGLTLFCPVAADLLWPIIWDLGSIQRYSPTLRDSRLLNSGEVKEGIVRRCTDHKGRRWCEKVIAVKPGRAFTLRFLSEQEDFPFPFRHMIGGWEVIPVKGGSEVRVWWECTPRISWLGPVLMPLVAMGLDKSLVGIITRMAAEAQGCNPSSMKNVHLLPRSC